MSATISARCHGTSRKSGHICRRQGARWEVRMRRVVTFRLPALQEAKPDAQQGNCALQTTNQANQGWAQSRRNSPAVRTLERPRSPGSPQTPPAAVSAAAGLPGCRRLRVAGGCMRRLARQHCMVCPVYMQPHQAATHLPSAFMSCQHGDRWPLALLLPTLDHVNAWKTMRASTWKQMRVC